VTDRDSLVEEIARLASDRGISVVTSESLTSGAVASALGQGPNAADWFAGGVVAYQEPVKFDVLGVPEGPVVSEQCAAQMARGARTLLGASGCVSVTGVGGPEPSEGEPPGTVWMAVSTGAAQDDDLVTRKVQLDGDPGDVVEKTVDVALELLLEVLRDD
jgi:nicotinamide-nucleotide amidase